MFPARTLIWPPGKMALSTVMSLGKEEEREGNKRARADFLLQAPDLLGSCQKRHVDPGPSAGSLSWASIREATGRMQGPKTWSPDAGQPGARAEGTGTGAAVDSACLLGTGLGQLCFTFLPQGHVLPAPQSPQL